MVTLNQRGILLIIRYKYTITDARKLHFKFGEAAQ